MLRWLVRVPALHRVHSKALELTKGRFEMTSRTITTVGILTGATLACSAMAQSVIYTCNFDNPPYAAGNIGGQQFWNTSRAGQPTPAGYTGHLIVSSGGPGPQAGNGFLKSENGTNSSTSARWIATRLPSASTSSMAVLLSAARSPVTTRPSSTSPAAPTRNFEYGTYAYCIASRAACRRASQSIDVIAGNDSHFIAPCTRRASGAA